METFFFKPELYNRLYNCTSYDIAQIPLEQRLTTVQNTAQIFLALNRCIDLAYGNAARVLFHGKRIYLWMIFCVIYGLCFCMFTMPIIFSSVIGTWFVNPHFAYNDDLSGTIYRNDLATIHSYMVVTVLTGTYLIFAIVLLTKMGFKCQSNGLMNAITNTNSQISSISQKKVFVQVFLISIINDAAATICALMNFLPVGNTLITLGQITWMLSFGIPPFIYLLLNKTIRQEVIGILRKLCSKLAPKIISKKIGTKTQIVIAVVKVGPAENVKKMNNPFFNEK
ncbi:hypothetical protein niasHS_005987 [Heterodera schachtii]|uniref:Uncharacterized protein n=1 Tax=Heterodera schachtii TaxID=97005 RepID=A0ABD2JN41_HETSC